MSITQEVVLVSLTGFESTQRFSLLSRLLSKIEPPIKNENFHDFLTKCNIVPEEHKSKLWALFINLESTSAPSLAEHIKIMKLLDWSIHQMSFFEVTKNKISPVPTWTDLNSIFEVFPYHIMDVCKTMFPILLKQGSPTRGQVLSILRKFRMNIDKLNILKLLGDSLPVIESMLTYQFYLGEFKEEIYRGNTRVPEGENKEEAVILLLSKLDLGTKETKPVILVEEKKAKVTYTIQLEGHFAETVILDWNTEPVNPKIYTNHSSTYQLELHEDGHYNIIQKFNSELKEWQRVPKN